MKKLLTILCLVLLVSCSQQVAAEPEEETTNSSSALPEKNLSKFDLSGARKAGYSDEEIAKHLADRSNFDLAGALAEGYTSTEVIQHLMGIKMPPTNDIQAFWKHQTDVTYSDMVFFFIIIIAGVFGVVVYKNKNVIGGSGGWYLTAILCFAIGLLSQKTSGSDAEGAVLMGELFGGSLAPLAGGSLIGLIIWALKKKNARLSTLVKQSTVYTGCFMALVIGFLLMLRTW